jgi:hypothetical protein
MDRGWSSFSATIASLAKNRLLFSAMLIGIAP